MDRDPLEFLKTLFHIEEEDDHSTWIRVATLKPEDVTRKIRQDVDDDKWHAECRLLLAKAKDSP